MSNVNNLNIFTFIKDIYQSLKHIDKTLSISNDALNTRISKLEENQQILIDKMTNIELVLIKLSETNKPNTGLDKNIEFELLEKMKKINQNEINNSKISLKSNELTFANILENNYSFNDINNTLEDTFGDSLGDIVDNVDNVDNNAMDINSITNNYSYINNSNSNNSNDILDTLDNLLF